MVAFALRRAGFEVTEAATSHDARVRLTDARPDLMLVDWMLPDMSGLELTRQVKRDPDTRDLPIIMLTARAAEGDKVAGLDGGADDYVTKPFSPRELLSRINAVLRRTGTAATDDTVDLGGLQMDRAAHRVFSRGAAVELGPTEYRMLDFFMQNPERV